MGTFMTDTSTAADPMAGMMDTFGGGEMGGVADLMDAPAEQSYQEPRATIGESDTDVTPPSEEEAAAGATAVFGAGYMADLTGDGTADMMDATAEESVTEPRATIQE